MIFLGDFSWIFLGIFLEILPGDFLGFFWGIFLGDFSGEFFLGIFLGDFLGDLDMLASCHVLCLDLCDLQVQITYFSDPQKQKEKMQK